MMKYLILSLLFLVGCSDIKIVENGVVKKLEVSWFTKEHREKHVVKISQPYKVKQSISCTYSGFCFWGGKYGYHVFCHGSQLAVVEYKDVQYYYTYNIHKVLYTSPNYEDAEFESVVEKITGCS